MTKHATRLLALTTIACAIPIAAAATPIKTAQSLYFDYNNATDECDNVNTFSGASAVNNWRSAIGAHATLGPNDNTIFWSEMADATFGGEDHINSNADTADFVFFSGHGGSNCGEHGCAINNWTLHLTTQSGSPSGCDWNTNSAAKIGNHNAEFVAAFGCDSMEPAYTPILNTKTPYLHQWYGYYGTMAPGNGTSDRTDDFVRESYLSGSSAALEWLENQLSKGHWGGPSDVCPVVMIRGNSKGDYEHRRDSEHFIEADFSHPTGAWTQSIFNCGCNPPGDRKPLC